MVHTTLPPLWCWCPALNTTFSGFIVGAGKTDIFLVPAHIVQYGVFDPSPCNWWDAKCWCGCCSVENMINKWVDYWWNGWKGRKGYMEGKANRTQHTVGECRCVTLWCVKILKAIITLVPLALSPEQCSRASLQRRSEAQPDKPRSPFCPHEALLSFNLHFPLLCPAFCNWFSCSSCKSSLLTAEMQGVTW